MTSFFHRIKALLAVVMLLASATTQAANSADPAASLQRFLDGVESFQAEFTQTQSDEDGKVMQKSTGQMWLRRAEAGQDSGRFRWDYSKPYEQQVVCDGRRIWLYDPDLAQVTVRSAAQALKGTPAALLSQRQVLRDTFDVRDGGLEAGRIQKLVLKPKSTDSEFQDVELWLDGDLPTRLRFRDPLGGSTDIVFSAARRNAAVKTSLFDFKPPKGVEVVDAGSEPTK